MRDVIERWERGREEGGQRGEVRGREERGEEMGGAGHGSCAKPT